MSIPRPNDIRSPALKLLAENDSLKSREFESLLAKHFNLSPNEMEQEYESGNAKIFYDRVTWALSYLYKNNLAQKPQRGVYQISEKGREMLKNPERLENVGKEYFKTTKKEKKDDTEMTQEYLTTEDLTPKEELYKSSEKIKSAIYDEIIRVILSKEPREFEKLVVMLLQKMGYGDEVKVTSYTNDKGIDGIIKEDVLGLGRVYIQAKRYAKENSVGRVEIQNFVGALAAFRPSKGVFITTSYYSNGATTYAKNISGDTTLVLIDGIQLAKYIYEYGLGMQVEQTIEIKKLDSDFWDSMIDDENSNI